MSGTPGASSYLNAYNAGSSRYVSNLRGLGFTDPQIAGYLQQRYPQLSRQQANQLIARADQAATAAQQLRNQQPGTTLRAADLRRPDPGQTRWRYTVLVTAQLQGGYGSTVPFTLTYNTSQTEAQVVADAVAQMQLTAQSSDMADTPFGGMGQDAFLINALLTAVERGQ